MESGSWKSSSRYSTMELPTGNPAGSEGMVTINCGAPPLVVLSDITVPSKVNCLMSAASARVTLPMAGVHVTFDGGISKASLHGVLGEDPNFVLHAFHEFIPHNACGRGW